MKTVRKSITFTDQQDNWIKLRVQNGDFTNDSEYIRDLVRRDQQQDMKLMELKNAIDEGLQSGRSILRISDIIERVDNGGL
jgi:antitoxin ParD1/3/4